ncbi:MAG: type II secretion system protein [Verrucomicrobiota bacterium]|jgi:prepilin-type N-terminal cleavage/methylation domain-containing protein/prepilin-type processing-associated H-X9-DG protein
MKAFGQNGRIQANGFREVRRVLCPAQPGFSLVELLITLVLMLIMTTMMWGFGSANRQRAEKKACQQNLSKIYLAMQIYANDYAGKLPETAEARTSEEALDVLVPRYTVDTSIFICPGGRDSALPEGESFRKRKISYAYYLGAHLNDAQQALMSDRQVNTQPKNAGDDAFSTTGKPPGNNHHKYGGNFLFCDGHMEMTPPRIPFSLATNQGVVLLNPRP